MVNETPFAVDPRVLRSLGVDPDLYLTALGPTTWGWVLDRDRDAVLIERVQAMQGDHATVQ